MLQTATCCFNVYLNRFTYDNNAAILKKKTLFRLSCKTLTLKLTRTATTKPQPSCHSCRK